MCRAGRRACDLLPKPFRPTDRPHAGWPFYSDGYDRAAGATSTRRTGAPRGASPVWSPNPWKDVGRDSTQRVVITNLDRFTDSHSGKRKYNTRSRDQERSLAPRRGQMASRGVAESSKLSRQDEPAVSLLTLPLLGPPAARNSVQQRLRVDSTKPIAFVEWKRTSFELLGISMQSS